MNQLLSYFSANPKRIFLIDALGALLTAFLLGVVLVAFQKKIGVSQSTLYTLSGIACLFAVYSLTCFFYVKNKWQVLLRVIAVLNLLYCCATLFLVFSGKEITSLGVAYFIIEIMIVLTLALFELKIARQQK